MMKHYPIISTDPPTEEERASWARTELREQELADAMRDAPELCAQCGTPLTDDDAPYLCDACTERASCAGSDIGEPWAVRYDPSYQPDRYGISVLGVLALACLIAALIGTARLERVRAQDTTLTAPHAINGRIYEWPDIGTDAYTRSCRIVRFFEDGSARAYCTEDGGQYRFDPEQGRWYDASTTR